MANPMKDIRDKSRDELVKKERELYDKLLKLRFQVATGQSENPDAIRRARRELARVKTVMRQQEMAAASAAAKE